MIKKALVAYVKSINVTTYIGGIMSKKSNMNFAVDGNAVVCNMIDGEIKARIVTRKNPEKKVITKKEV